MQRAKVLWSLAIVNAVLLTALMWKLGGDNPAHAQGIGRGDIIMIPADVSGANAGAVYMIHTREGLLTAFSYDTSARLITAMNPINLRRLLEGGGGLGGGGNPGGGGVRPKGRGN
jgi:hypothetical protein